MPRPFLLCGVSAGGDSTHAIGPHESGTQSDFVGGPHAVFPKSSVASRGGSVSFLQLLIEQYGEFGCFRRRKQLFFIGL
jgi:hypothetical protein